MKYRIVKRCDLDHIVDLHLKVRETYDIGFFSKMKRSFLKKYYQIRKTEWECFCSFVCSI